MQTNTNLRVVENNSHATKDFTIQASGKMFHMVISGLYSNKPQSITRELWSNAFDAHAMVGKQDVPFEVTFPTPLSPVFSCRDFGAGIAHENMEGFYTVLGHSTKENTNKAVGKWGVGRMSPMSYTDTFSVVSRHKGMVAYYSIQLGPDGSPQLHVLAEPMPTNEPDGLEVSFPVKRDDLASFQRAAEVVSYGFKLPPNVKNSQDKQFQPIKKSLTGEGYYFYDDNRLSGPYAQMGCVLYPINKSVIEGGLLPARNHNIIYEFDIGDLEVTASRESLSYGANDPTVKSLNKTLKRVKMGMFAAIQKEIDTQPSMFRAMKLSIKANRLTGDATYLWGGKAVLSSKIFLDYPLLDYHVGSKGWNSKTIGFGNDIEAVASREYTFYVQDVKDKKGNARAATRIASNLKSNEDFIWVKLDMDNPEAKASLDQMVSDLDYPVVYVKDLPDSGPVKSSPRGKLTVSTLTKDGLTSYPMDSTEFQVGGYYFPMVANRYPPYLIKMIPLWKSQVGQEIILAPKPMWKKFEGATQWKLLKPKLNEIIKNHAKLAQDVLGNNYNTYPYNQLRAFESAGGILGLFAQKAKAIGFSEYLGVGFSAWCEQFERLGLPQINNDTVKEDHKKILDKYPLLKLYNGWDAAIPDYLQYIKLIDNA